MGNHAKTTDAPRSTPTGQRSASAWALELFQIQMQRNGSAIQIAHSVVQRRTGASAVSETGLIGDRRLLIPNLVETLLIPNQKKKFTSKDLCGYILCTIYT